MVSYNSGESYIQNILENDDCEGNLFFENFEQEDDNEEEEENNDDNNNDKNLIYIDFTILLILFVITIIFTLSFKGLITKKNLK